MFIIIKLNFNSVIESTLFKKYYDRGDLPIAVSFHGAVRKVINNWIILNTIKLILFYF